MPAANIHDDQPYSDYSHLLKDQPPVPSPPVKHRTSQTLANSDPATISQLAERRSANRLTQDGRSNDRESRKPQDDNPNPMNNSLQPDGRSTRASDSQDVKESESKKRQNDRDLQSTKAPRQTASSRSTADQHDGRSGSGRTSNNEDLDSAENDYAAARAQGTPREREQSSVKTSRVSLTTPQHDPTQCAQPTRSSKDPQHPPGVAEGTAPHHHQPSSRTMNSQVSPSHQPARSSNDLQHPPGVAEETAPHHHQPSSRSMNAQAISHHPEGEQRDRMSDSRQASQAGYGGGVFDTFLSFTGMGSSGNSSPPTDKYEHLKDEHRRVRDELKKMHATLDAHERELKRTRAELRHSNHSVDQLHHENLRAKDNIKGLQNELNNVHHQLQDAKHLSEVRGKELFGAQVFLTKADTLSISEVGEKVAALNEEIFQAAATLGEALIHKRHDVSQPELDAATAESVQILGDKMTKLLISQSQKPEPEVNPLIVQVVLQIFMVNFCVSKIQSWYPGDSTIGGFLTAIYSEIHSTEEQAVSGRWRALTRAHTRPTTETWQKELYQKLSFVLKVAAWMPASAGNEEAFGHRLPPIFKAVNELRMAIGEKFTSADLDISVFDCDRTYDPSIMDDAYGDGRQPSSKRAPDTIVGTTGIGLMKAMVERGGSTDTPQFRSVIPAKIVLKSTLNEALEPVKAPRLRRLRKIVAESMDSADSKAVNMDVSQG